MSKPKSAASIRDAVMHDIQAGNVTMRPRVYYVTLSALAGLTVITAGLSAAYFMSIVYFWVRIIRADGMAYGARLRLSDALASFPWWLLLLSIGLAVAAVVLVRRQGHMYKHRSSTIVVLLLLVSLVLGAALASFNIGQPYAQSHAPMMQQRGQNSQSGHGRMMRE